MIIISDTNLYFKGNLYINSNGKVMLLHFTDDNDNHYLAKWCKVDGTNDEWLLIKTNKLFNYFKREISLYNLTEKAEQLWKIELDSDLKLWFEEEIQFNQLEEDYLPLYSSMYVESAYTSYAKQLYSLLYDKNKEREEKEGCIALIIFAVTMTILFALMIYFSS